MRSPSRISCLNTASRTVHLRLTESAIKYHSGCYLGLCALDAAIALREEVEVDDIQAISVHTYRYGLEMTADGPAKWRPQTRETADHSLPFLLAMGLREGFVGPEHYIPQHYTDPRLLDLMDKVTVAEESRYSEQFPHVQTQRVEVRTRSGAHLVQQVDFPKGHPENPMTDIEVQTKFRRLTAAHLSADQAEAAMAAVLDLENAGDLQALSQTLVL